jgi:hypothetical protein
VVIFPLLVWAYTAMFVFWDAFKTQNINLKATYTIADMISREQEEICDDYIEGARSIYAFLNAGDANHQVRVTNVQQVPDADGNPTTSSGPGRPRASRPTRKWSSSRARADRWETSTPSSS